MLYEDYPIRRFCFGGFFRQRFLFERWFKRDKIYAAEMLTEYNFKYSDIFQRHLAAPTYEYHGDMLSNMGGTGPDETRCRTTVPLHEQRNR